MKTMIWKEPKLCSLKHRHPNLKRMKVGMDHYRAKGWTCSENDIDSLQY
jgi:hypothetical protein